MRVLASPFGHILAMLLVSAGTQASAGSSAESAKEILKRSISFETSEGKGQVPALAAYYASILKQAGYSDDDVEITPVGETAFLEATLKGSDPKLKPLLLSGHMDVVPANKSDWTRDPFTAVEENGYVFGRGALDMKYEVAMLVSTMAQLKKEGFKPKRTIVLLLSGDEETAFRTTRILAEKYRNAELMLNADGSGGQLDNETGEPVLFAIAAAEKTVADFIVTFTDPGGHSSMPTSTNPIYKMARALERVEALRFPAMSNELTRASMTAASKRVGGQVGAALKAYAENPQDMAAAELLSSQPKYVGQVRTTCVATTVKAGHAPNALPQSATFNINCRIFPGVPVQTVKAELIKVIADPSAEFTSDEQPAVDASPLRKDVMAAITKAVHARYPGLDVVPSMEAGASDSLHFRAAGIPSYNAASLFSKPSDNFAHGLNERVQVGGIAASLEYWRSVIKDLSQ